MDDLLPTVAATEQQPPADATFIIHGITLTVPQDASSKALWAAAELLDRLGQERYLCETADSGGT